MASLSELRQALEAQEEVVSTCQEAIDAGLDDDPDILQNKSEAEAAIKDLKAQIAALKPTAPPPPPSTNIPPPPPPEEIHIPLNVGDECLAKWKKDQQMYPATVISKTGSSKDPFYTVRFKGYGDTDTLKKNEVKAVESRKRKAEDQPVVKTDRTVITKAPAIDESLVQKKEPSKVSDGPTRLPREPKKLKNSKALDSAKSKWNDFQAKGPKKGTATTTLPKVKESQFRTGALPNAKVGFTGSGKAMTKDKAKGVWKFGDSAD